MNLRNILAGILILALPLSTAAQSKGKGKAKGKAKHSKAVKAQNKAEVKGNKDVYYGTAIKKNGPPAWAPAHGYRAKQHAYFRDYYTFYDANRGGYVYWDDHKWTFSQSVPTFLKNIDLGAARLEFLNDIPITVRPETKYSVYLTQYPARPVSIPVATPVLR